MIKGLLVIALFFNILQAKVFVFVDGSQGLGKEPLIELNKNAPFKRSKSDLFQNNEEVFLYFANAKKTISQDFVYFKSSKKEQGWKDARKSYFHFLKRLKKIAKHDRKKTTLFGGNTIFLVDTSGSMRTSNRMNEVKNAMLYFTKRKDSSTKVAIITFDGIKSEKISQRATIKLNFSNNKNKILQAIKSIHPSRKDTYLGAGFAKVDKLLKNVNISKTNVILFTDADSVYDEKIALEYIKKFKKQKVILKTIATEGADIDILHKYTTTGNVYDATSRDLNAVFQTKLFANDEIFLKLYDFLSNSGVTLSNKDKVIIYSTMMNIDSKSDFFVIPNLADENAYQEVMQTNRNRGIEFNFNGANVYVRLTSSATPDKIQELRIFYKRFFKDTNAKLKFFSNSKLKRSLLK